MPPILFRRWREAARALALLALLANAGLLPALHLAAGGPAAVAASAEAAGHHGHRADEGGGDREPAGAGHQLCHFCRLLGAALPPPAAIVIAILPAAPSGGWPAARPLAPRQPPLRLANPPRAPPPTA